MNDKDYIIVLLSKILANVEYLPKIYEFLERELSTEPKDIHKFKEINLTPISSLELAKWIGSSYKTQCPEICEQGQYDGLLSMIEGTKFETCLLKWLRSNKNSNKDFLSLPLEEQRKQCYDAVINYKDTVLGYISQKISYKH